MELRRTGASFGAIGEELGVSGEWVRRIYYDTLRQIPAEAVATYRQEQLERLDHLQERANEVLARKHLTVQNGKVVTLPHEGDDGATTDLPLEDDGPTLEAVRTILQIEKLRAELLGTPAPQRIEALAVVRYEIVGVDMEALR